MESFRCPELVTSKITEGDALPALSNPDAVPLAPIGIISLPCLRLIISASGFHTRAFSISGWRMIFSGIMRLAQQAQSKRLQFQWIKAAVWGAAMFHSRYQNSTPAECSHLNMKGSQAPCALSDDRPCAVDGGEEEAWRAMPHGQGSPWLRPPPSAGNGRPHAFPGRGVPRLPGQRIDM